MLMELERTLQKILFWLYRPGAYPKYLKTSMSLKGALTMNSPTKTSLNTKTMLGSPSSGKLTSLTTASPNVNKGLVVEKSPNRMHPRIVTDPEVEKGDLNCYRNRGVRFRI